MRVRAFEEFILTSKVCGLKSHGEYWVTDEVIVALGWWGEREITCRKCGAPLRGVEVAFVLKDFLVRDPGSMGEGA